jgi:glycosyltransferase involved in cell wall biosynthesis
MPKKYLLYVGNAHPHKNVENLIRAMRVMRKMGRMEGLKLALIGNDKFFYPRLEKWIKKGGMSETIEVVGEVPNTKIASWYRHAEALVTASKMEGFGIPPLEAMSVGCPAIVSDIPVFHEVLGDAAVYFNQNDPEDMARVIKKTLGDMRGLREMKEKGYRQAKKYSWEKLVRETYKVYESCVSL